MRKATSAAATGILRVRSFYEEASMLNRRLSLKIALGLLGLALCLFAYTKLARHFAPADIPVMAPSEEQANRVVAYKATRKLELYRDDTLLRSYPISLGGDPQGAKAYEGDQKTPEGSYVIDWRNPKSMAYLSLHISYPSPAQTRYAQQQGRTPGGNIMIHGIVNGWGFLAPLLRHVDWTDGCIAVSNEAMREIWSLVPNGTQMMIHP